MRRLLHPFVLMPVVAAVAVAVWWFALRSEPTSSAAATTAPTSQLTEATSGSMNETVSAEGTVAAAQTDDLSFASSGTVTAVGVKAGDAVTAGQVLATIDSAQLSAAVTAAESDLADAQAKLSDDQDADASDEQIAADIASVATANDTLTNAKEALSGSSLVATFDGTVASVDLTVGEELASSGQGGTTLTGSGTGSGRSSSSIGSTGAATGAQSPTATTSSTSAQIQVVSSGRFEVEVSVDSADIDRVAVGQATNITVTTSSTARRGGFGGFGGGAFPGGAQATNRQAGGAGTTGTGATGAAGPTGANGTQRGTTGASVTGSVTSVSQVADASSGVAGYKVVVSFEAPTDQIYVGSSVTADIVTAERTDVVQVPTRAVTTTDSGSTVEISTDGTVGGATETRTVQLGLTANGMTEITSGVDAGEQVVVNFPGRGFPTAAASAASR